MMQVSDGIYDVGKVSLLESADEILTFSGQIVPEDTGALKSSRFVDEPQTDHDEGRVTLELGYGGIADTLNPKTGEMTSSYALKVHEDLVTPHKPGKSAKYLEIPLVLHTKRMFVTLQKGLEDYFGSIGGQQAYKMRHALTKGDR